MSKAYDIVLYGASGFTVRFGRFNMSIQHTHLTLLRLSGKAMRPLSPKLLVGIDQQVRTGWSIRGQAESSSAGDWCSRHCDVIHLSISTSMRLIPLMVLPPCMSPASFVIISRASCHTHLPQLDCGFAR